MPSRPEYPSRRFSQAQAGDAIVQGRTQARQRSSVGKNQRYLYLTSGFYNDYYIMVVSDHLRTLPFPKRTFFWANENFRFAPLPEVRKPDEALLASFNDYFTGEHDKILKEGQSDFDHLDLDDDDRILTLT